MNSPIIKPTVGRVVWFHPSENTDEAGFARHQVGEPYAAIIAHVHSDRCVNLSVLDANGIPHSRTSVELIQEGGTSPGFGFYCEWMPYQKGQAAKTEAAEKVAAEAPAMPQYREPTQRDQLEYALVSGAAGHLAQSPCEAGNIAAGIKTVLNALSPKVVEEPKAARINGPFASPVVRDTSDLQTRAALGLGHATQHLQETWGLLVQNHSDERASKAGIALAEHDAITGLARRGLHSANADPLEREIQAKADNGPRVTPAALKDEIVSEHYFTAGEGIAGRCFREVSALHSPRELELLTFCVLVLKNGFTVTGESAGASPESFDGIGRRVARENAVQKIWPLLGFRLRDELARPVLTDADAAADLAGMPRESP